MILYYGNNTTSYNTMLIFVERADQIEDENIGSNALDLTD
jgi:hypothetical protein